MSYHDEQMRKRCEESGTHPATSDGKLRNDSCELVAHGDRFVYASEYEALEADNAALRDALKRIANESQGLRLRYRHERLGESSPPLIEDIAKDALKQEDA